MEYKKNNDRMLKHWASVPFIYMMIVPFVIVDIFVEIYHRICFPLYGIPTVKRWSYIRIDRHKLKYLSVFDKFNCAYCGYVNGLAAYIVRIAGDTEKYWCGIKHAEVPGVHIQEHQKDFLKYGDEKAYRKKYCKLEKKK